MSDTLQDRLRFQTRYTHGLVPVTMTEAADRLDAQDRRIAELEAENADRLSQMVALNHRLHECKDVMTTAEGCLANDHKLKREVARLTAALNKYSEDEILCAKDKRIAELEAAYDVLRDTYHNTRMKLEDEVAKAEQRFKDFAREQELKQAKLEKLLAVALEALEDSQKVFVVLSRHHNLESTSESINDAIKQIKEAGK